MYDWHELQIKVSTFARGNVKTVCPQCRDGRGNKRDKSLSVNVSEGIFLCHHCGWAGKAKRIGELIMHEPPPKRTVYTKPKFESQANPEDRLIAWFAKRGISEAVVRRNRIEAREIWMSEEEPAARAIAFPYFRAGEVVNVQYRTADKRFKLEKGCELILYGLDDIRAAEPLIWVEGQLDKLALEEAGYTNCVSVPNGAKNIHGEWLESAKEQLAKASYHILAGDNDDPGKACQEELARRLGPEKCWRVEWPDGCKDANDVLLKHGKMELISAIECARPLPINGIVELIDLLPEIENLYFEGMKGGLSTGWYGVDQIYRPRLGEFTVLTGTPGTGKSTFIDALLMNLAMMHDWTFAIFSPEQQPLARHAANLLQIFKGQPFSDGPSQRIQWEGVKTATRQLSQAFKLLSPADDDLSIEGIIKLAKACITRYGIQGLVIDPWNELENTRPDRMSETEFIGESLRKLRRFARLHQIHLWIIVHPTKLRKSEAGGYEKVTPYDLNGSANWFNKADMILSLHRDKTAVNSPVEVDCQKVRFQENGQLGQATLYWDRRTSRFAESLAAGFMQEWEGEYAVAATNQR